MQTKSFRLSIIIWILFLGFLTEGCERKKDDNSESQETTSTGSLWTPSKDFVAKIYTSKGLIKVGLEFEKTPMTVANFVALADGSLDNLAKPKGVKFYDGQVFHRVEPNFMIQGGDPKGSDPKYAGTGNSGVFFPDEIVDGLIHDGPGVLSMANSGPNSNSCQFFITHTATQWLDGKHTVFGRVIEGQEVVNAIQIGDRIDSIRFDRNSEAAKGFMAPEVFKTQKEILTQQANLEKQSQLNSLQGGPVYRAFEEYVKQVYPNAQKTASGLYYIKHTNTDGTQPLPGNIVKVHYKGTLTNKKVFDESYGRGNPIEFPIGKGQVIAGWDEGISLLRKGERATLIIPYYLAYGDEGMPGAIGPKETLIFDVELIDVK